MWYPRSLSISSVVFLALNTRVAISIVILLNSVMNCFLKETLLHPWWKEVRKDSRSVNRRRHRRVAAAASKANVLVVGGGGREHALCWKLQQSSHCGSLYCAPGNAGIFTEPKVERTTIADVSNHEEVVGFCETSGIDVVVIGPEVPLVCGLVDDLNKAGIQAFGPSKPAAQLEGSKTFMKSLCRRHHIPTGRYEQFTDSDAAKDFIRVHGAPIVVKADGLAAGKGAIVCRTEAEAFKAVDKILVQKSFGSAGTAIVIEEFLDGEEASYFALIDGNHVLPLTSAQDHKAVGEGDVGENTGGMGAYSPAPVVTTDIERRIISEILQPTADAMVEEGIPFKGVLFAGLMIKEDKVNLLEYNVRFGDPECQSILMRMKADLLDLILKTCDGELDRVSSVEWDGNWALTIVLASQGYPGAYKKGTRISQLDHVFDAKVFHAGTALNSDGDFVSNGGRVLGITSTAQTVSEAQRKGYQALDSISWPEGFCRRDIGWRAIQRERLQQ